MDYRKRRLSTPGVDAAVVLVPMSQEQSAPSCRCLQCCRPAAASVQSTGLAFSPVRSDFCCRINIAYIGVSIVLIAVITFIVLVLQSF